MGADYVAIGRGLVADPLFVGKLLGEVQGAIRPCLACAEGCLGGVKSGQGLKCVVNPTVNQKQIPQFPAQIRKKIAVVGGGPAGMQAALSLAERGMEVDLYEKEKLGGQFNLASLPPNKQSLKAIVDYFAFELSRNGVHILFEEATAEKLLSRNYDVVVLATGAKPAIPPIEGMKEYYWAEFLYDENLPVNKKILIIGGGLIGIEIASKLVEKRNQVTIVEMMDELARGMEMIEKKLTLQKLHKHQVQIITHSKVERVEGDTVYISGDKEWTMDGIDHIVVATGMKSYNPLEPKLKEKVKVIVIGDARKVGKAQTAILDGYRAAMTI